MNDAEDANEVKADNGQAGNETICETALMVMKKSASQAGDRGSPISRPTPGRATATPRKRANRSRRW